jgi:AraC-like DNA-binding protein
MKPASHSKKRAAAPAAPPISPLAALIAAQAHGEWFSESRLPGVQYMRSTETWPRSPVIYDPGIVIIAQGRKCGYLNGHVFEYDPLHYLVLAAPMPFACATFGSPESPLLGLHIGVSPSVVAELLLAMKATLPTIAQPPLAMSAHHLTPALESCAIRLLECLQNDTDARILGPSLVREILYRVLGSEAGLSFRALAVQHGGFAQISRVMANLHRDCTQPVSVSSLAAMAGMSASTFHAHFKLIAGTPPLRYLKNLRLQKSLMLMVHEGMTAAQAAGSVGYESTTQFSREFHRYYDESPLELAKQWRRALAME